MAWGIIVYVVDTTEYHLWVYWIQVLYAVGMIQICKQICTAVCTAGVLVLFGVHVTIL